MGDGSLSDVFRRLVNKLKILGVCLQVLCSLVSTLVVEQNIPYPDFMIDGVDTINEIISGNLNSIIPFSCFLPRGKNHYMYTLMLNTLSPLAIIVLIMVYFETKKRLTKDPEVKRKLGSWCWSLITLLLFIVL